MVRRPQFNRRKVLLAVAAQILCAKLGQGTGVPRVRHLSFIVRRIAPRQTCLMTALIEADHAGNRQPRDMRGARTRISARDFRTGTRSCSRRRIFRGFAHLGVLEVLERSAYRFPSSWVPALERCWARRTRTGFPFKIFAILAATCACAISFVFTRRSPARPEGPHRPSWCRNGWRTTASRNCQFPPRSSPRISTPPRLTFLLAGPWTRPPRELRVSRTGQAGGIRRPSAGRWLHRAPVPTAVAARMIGGCVLGVNVGSRVRRDASTGADKHVKDFDAAADFRFSHQGGPQRSWSHTRTFSSNPQCTTRLERFFAG